MICYALACRQGHAFESWFRSSDAFDEQVERGLILCPSCGSADVEKALMAPNLSRTKKSSTSRIPAAQETPPEAKPEALIWRGTAVLPCTGCKPGVACVRTGRDDIAAGAGAARQAAWLRDYLTRNAEHVGSKFPEEARKMHYGESDARSIYGEATPEEASELIEEGIEFHPLPPLPDDHN